MAKRSKEEKEEERKKELLRTLRREPDLDRFIDEKKRTFVSYISQLVIDTYSNQIGVFHTCIPLSVRAAEISAEGSSIYQYDPKGKAANAYRTLTEEVLDRG